jgi:hypothetical protein
VMETAASILLELRVLKEEKGYDYAFLSVVDILRKRTWLLLCGERELALARVAFGGPTAAACDARKFTALHESLHLMPNDTKMDLGSRVSRKLEFVPPIVDALTSGWEPSLEENRRSMAEEAPFAFLQKPGACCALERQYSRKGDTIRASQVRHVGHDVMA